MCLALSLEACASYPLNPPLDHDSASQGYRYENLKDDDSSKNSEETFVILTFSGGGTRAAALSYGVLEHLGQPRLDGGKKTLLDEVDVISSVSGGSFTAAYYGLFGKEKFFRDFKEAVLYRSIANGIVVRVLAPWNWPRLLSPYFGRSEVADEYYDRNIFEGRTYADMPRKRPFIIINATDMTLGAQFSFTQDDFDRLCSDLSGVHVSRAVTASSAFPVAFTPLTFNNYPKKDCVYSRPEWVQNGLKDFHGVPSRYARANTWISYEDSTQREFIHLNDGGLADNIGLRGPEVAITTNDSTWSLLNKANSGLVKRIAVIVVDAKPGKDLKLDGSAKPPGVLSVLEASATNPMENYSSDTVELVRKQFVEWDKASNEFTKAYVSVTEKCGKFARQVCVGTESVTQCAEARGRQCLAVFRDTEDDRPPHPELYRIHVRLDAIKDPAVRSQVERIPTTLQLARDDVNLLIDVAARLLDESSDYPRLLRDLKADNPAKWMGHGLVNASPPRGS
jgi:NTE family protein